MVLCSISAKYGQDWIRDQVEGGIESVVWHGVHVLVLPLFSGGLDVYARFVVLALFICFECAVRSVRFSGACRVVQRMSKDSQSAA